MLFKKKLIKTNQVRLDCVGIYGFSIKRQKQGVWDGLCLNIVAHGHHLRLLLSRQDRLNIDQYSNTSILSY